MRKNELEKVVEDKIEIVKQAEINEIIVLQGQIIPKRNHTLFECSIDEKTVCIAKYESAEKEVSFDEAIKKKEKLILGRPKFKTKGKVIIQKKHLYISALNFKNVVKILEREYKLFGFEYVKE